MSKEKSISRIIREETGLLIKYAKKWNPFNVEAQVIIKVRDMIISIPIDVRQRRFIEKEYPVGSQVDLYFDGEWHIKSKPDTGEPLLFLKASSTYV